MKKRKLTSAHEIGQRVTLKFFQEEIPCEIAAIRFTYNKVRYDLNIIMDENYLFPDSKTPVVLTTAIKNVDSAFVY